MPGYDIYREKNFFSKARLKTLQSSRKVWTFGTHASGTWWNFAGSEYHGAVREWGLLVPQHKGIEQPGRSVHQSGASLKPIHVRRY